MTVLAGFARKSYLKTTIACTALVAGALVCVLLALHILPTGLAAVVAVPGILVALGAATLACASALVLVRYRRAARGDPDLFLELNRSREPDAIKARGAPRTTWLRRWLARRFLGHDFVVGDTVEVRPWAEIRTTLDEQGCLEQLPFMPEMRAMCGRRAHVFRCIHRLFDYRKTRRMRHMNGAVLLVGTVCDGSKHGGCEAACHTIWKSAWLRRVEPSNNTTAAHDPFEPSDQSADTSVLQVGTQAPFYTCQLTQLNAASQPLPTWSVSNGLRPLISGNVTPAAFVVGWLTYLFNELQHRRHGVAFPEFEVVAENRGKQEEPVLVPGDRVIVRSPSEIRTTLNDQMMNRGLWFEPDMLKHCGRAQFVQSEVRRLIDIVSGEVRTMKTPAYILRDIHFSGERQLFNAQYEPLFWRGAWLRRDGS